MITKFHETERGLELQITPETVEENAILLRYGINAKAEKPDVFYGFQKEPYLSVWLKKKAKSAQVFSIAPSRKS